MPRETQRLTGERLVEYMRHRLGKTPASRHKLIDNLNEAGRELFQAGMDSRFGFHTWSWTANENVPLPIKSGEELVELPADFGTLIGVQEENRVVGSVQLSSVAHMLELRADTTVSPLTIWLAFDVGPKDAGNFADTEVDTDRQYAAIYPVQESDRDDIRINYTRRWQDYPVGDDALSSASTAELQRVPNIPPEWDRALKLLCMAMAFEDENDMPSPDYARYEREIARLVTYDSARQTEYGYAAYSVRDRARGSRGFQYPHKSISRP